MLAGDFTAIAVAGLQRPAVTLTPAAGFVNNTIDPSRVQPGRAEVPASTCRSSTDPCGRLQYGIPNNNTEHQTLGKRRLHAELAARPCSRRYLYAVYDNPGDLRRQERADAQPHRPEQPGALAGRRPQLGAVAVDA